MSAQLDPALRFRRMSAGDLDAVMSIENVIYTHPWTPGNFADSLSAGNDCRVLECSGVMTGYAVLMSAASEAHLLNLSIAASWQGRGLGRALLHHMIDAARASGAQKIILEVRASNAAARALYAKSGFREIGVRRGYYPAHGGREDAVVLEFPL